MKKCILLILLSGSSLLAMKNNDPRPIHFDSKEILYHRLLKYDEKHNTNYASFALKYDLHNQLGNSIRTREEVSTLIKFTLKKNDPSLPEAEIIKHKTNIIIGLRPELHEKMAKM